jgi:membrane protease YdiL (CAAX protease family)
MTAHAIEFLLLFLAGPSLFAFTRHRIPAIPALWVLMAYCLIILLRDPKFDREHLWHPAPLPHAAPAILGLYAAALVLGIVCILRYAPETIFNLPRTKPLLWGALMVLYPILSVYPQGIVYRAFLFYRYHDLFSAPWAIVAASTFAFTYVHIIFRNPVAIGLTFLGGVIFAFRYLDTGSLFVSSFEHALYGCGVFTIGLGRFLYHGAVQRNANLAASSAFAASNSTPSRATNSPAPGTS